QQEQQAEQQRMLSQQLISSAEQMVRQARQVTTSLLQQAEKSAQHLVEKVEPLLPLIERVIVQARTRVLEGKQVAGSRQSARGALSLIRVSFRGTKGVHLLSLVGESNSGARGRRNCDTVPDWRRIPMSMDKGSSPWNTISISLATPMDASFRSRSAFCGDRGASEGLGGRASGHSSAGQDGMERWIGFGIIGSRSAQY